MGQTNTGPFLNDPSAIEFTPDYWLLAVPARAQVNAALAPLQPQLQQQRAQNDAIRLQIRAG